VGGLLPDYLQGEMACSRLKLNNNWKGLTKELLSHLAGLGIAGSTVPVATMPFLPARFRLCGLCGTSGGVCPSGNRL